MSRYALLSDAQLVACLRDGSRLSLDCEREAALRIEYLSKMAGASPREPSPPSAFVLDQADVRPLARWLWPDLHVVDGRVVLLMNKINALNATKARSALPPEVPPAYHPLYSAMLNARPDHRERSDAEHAWVAAGSPFYADEEPEAPAQGERQRDYNPEWRLRPTRDEDEPPPSAPPVYATIRAEVMANLTEAADAIDRIAQLLDGVDVLDEAARQAAPAEKP